MKYWFEDYAIRCEPIPDYRKDGTPTTFDDRIKHSFLRNLYWSLKHGVISREQGQIEKNKGLHDEENLFNARELERRCWELSAKRTFAASHAMVRYHLNRTIENADNLYEKLEWLLDELPEPVRPHEHGANCPVCGKFFNQDHADRKPKFCEDCGCMLRWEP